MSRFFPGVLPDPPISASPGKRRSQSLSALPKDDKTSPGKVNVYTCTLSFKSLGTLRLFNVGVF